MGFANIQITDTRILRLRTSMYGSQMLVLRANQTNDTSSAVVWHFELNNCRTNLTVSGISVADTLMSSFAIKYT